MPKGLADVPQPAGEAYVEDGLLQGGRASRTPNVEPGAVEVLPAPAPVGSDVGGIVPTQAPLTTLQLCARIDPGNDVIESDETNNVHCISVVVQTFG